MAMAEDTDYYSSSDYSSSTNSIDSFDLDHDIERLRNRIVINNIDAKQKENELKKLVYYYMTHNERNLRIMLTKCIANIVYSYYYHQNFIIFDKVARIGQLFLKYTGKRRRKPQDRIVKVLFDSHNKPTELSWGGHTTWSIKWDNIAYIVSGHHTPAFKARINMDIDAKKCFSVVSKEQAQILDLQALYDEKTVIIWVTGLRLMLNQSDDEADKLLQNDLEKGWLTLKKKNSPKRKQEIETVQKDLFILTAQTVFRSLEEERIWDIDQSVMDKFDAQILYQRCMSEDIPGTQWNHWIKDKVTTYLKENNRFHSDDTTCTATKNICAAMCEIPNVQIQLANDIGMQNQTEECIVM